jgi:hypothetical protein
VFDAAKLFLPSLVISGKAQSQPTLEQSTWKVIVGRHDPEPNDTKENDIEHNDTQDSNK